MSEFKTWEQKTHTNEWLIYFENIGLRLSTRETFLSNRELIIIVTNKERQERYDRCWN